MTYHGHAELLLVGFAQLQRDGGFRLAHVVGAATQRDDAVRVHGRHLLHAAVDKRIRAARGVRQRQSTSSDDM